MDIKEDLLWKQLFFKDNFNIDQCLSKYTLKSDLETLRGALKNYGNELHEQMADILKTETEGIVNLAEYLTNLNSKIDDLSLPISQLREEIKSLYELIKDAQQKYGRTLNVIKNNNMKKGNINLKLEITTSSIYINYLLDNDLLKDSIMLERAVNRYSFQYNYLEETGIIVDTEQSVIEVGIKLTNIVNETFLKSLENDDNEVIIRCLRMYDNLGKQQEAEQTYQINVVRPAMKNIFTEKRLEFYHRDLHYIYKEALTFVDDKMKNLLNIVNQVGLSSFNFILNSFWSEIDQLSRTGLPHITAPGNPELFQIRYITTWTFLHEIAARCHDENIIKTNQSFVEHLQRFNLPVYFEIKYQQIACVFEREILKTAGSKIYADRNETLCKLSATVAVLENIRKCFYSDVFIDDLVTKFFHLAMLIFARYFRWFEIMLEDISKSNETKNDCDTFVMSSLYDLNLFQSIDCNAKMPPKAIIFMPKLLQLNAKRNSEICNRLKDYIIEKKNNESMVQLRNVAAIPRLYRRTNRNTPNSPSSYMVVAVEPIMNFHKIFHKTPNFNQIIDAIISKISKEYLLLVRDVLMSVCKTEKSLRRLKNRNTTLVEETQSTDTISDEMKIRKQIQLDVDYLLAKLYNLGLDESRLAMDALKNETSNRYES